MNNLELPELPEGYFWRVAGPTGLVSVQVRKNRVIGSKKMADSFVFEDATPEAAIVAAASRALVKFERVADTAAFDHSVDEWKGRY